MKALMSLINLFRLGGGDERKDKSVVSKEHQARA
jgi:hypothetical protein